MTNVEPRHVFRLRDEFESADVGMVFGNENDEPLRARVNHAADLYHQKKLGKLLLTGGRSKRNRGDEKSESDKMSEIALEKGVHERDILIETESSNTGENFSRCLPILKCCSEFRRFSSVALISCPSHMGRVLMIGQHYFGDRERLFCSHADYGYLFKHLSLTFLKMSSPLPLAVLD